jgi:hypothetical protein
MQMSRNVNKLYYQHCGNEVQLGDSVSYKRVCRGPVSGTVVYMPGISPVHQRFERQGFKQWAIRLENGWILAWVFSPSERQPSHRIRLVRRADSGFVGLSPTDELL